MGPTTARAGRYELREQIADGPRGPTFRARDPRHGQDVLVQRFSAPLPAGAWARYMDVVSTARRANMTGAFLPIELVADDPAAPFAVLALRVGESVEALRRRAGPLQWSRSAELVLRCAEALAAIASKTGQSHRALDPSVLWLAPGGELSLLDLGVAELGPCPTPPRDGPLCVEYRAPEQLEGAPGDARSDVFTLGVLLCELSCGVHPFAGPSAFQAARKLLLGTPPPMSEVVRGMSPAAARAAERLLGKALALHPDDRFQGAAELLRALEFARHVIGAPAWHPVTAAVIATPTPSSPSALDDPTTMLQIPRMNIVRPVEPGSPIVAPGPSGPPSISSLPSAMLGSGPPDDERTSIHERRPAWVAPVPPRKPDTIQRSTMARSAAVLEPTLVLPGASRGADPDDVPTEIALPRLKASAGPERLVQDPDGTLIVPAEPPGTPGPKPSASRLLLGLTIFCAALLLAGLAAYVLR